jgi:hypothetical protein
MKKVRLLLDGENIVPKADFAHLLSILVQYIHCGHDVLPVLATA